MAGCSHIRLGSQTRDRDRRRCGLFAQHRQVVGLTDEQRQCQLVEICGDALIAAGRVDHDDGGAALQYTEQGRDVYWSIAKHDADLGSLVADDRGHPIGQPAKLSPRKPLALMFQCRRVGFQTQYVVDAPTERVCCHRILGSGA